MQRKNILNFLVFSLAFSSLATPCLQAKTHSATTTLTTEDLGYANQAEFDQANNEFAQKKQNPLITKQDVVNMLLTLGTTCLSAWIMYKFQQKLAKEDYNRWHGIKNAINKTPFRAFSCKGTKLGNQATNNALTATIDNSLLKQAHQDRMSNPTVQERINAISEQLPNIESNEENTRLWKKLCFLLSKPNFTSIKTVKPTTIDDLGRQNA